MIYKPEGTFWRRLAYTIAYYVLCALVSLFLRRLERYERELAFIAAIAQAEAENAKPFIVTP